MEITPHRLFACKWHSWRARGLYLRTNGSHPIWPCHPKCYSPLGGYAWPSPISFFRVDHCIHHTEEVRDALVQVLNIGVWPIAACEILFQGDSIVPIQECTYIWINALMTGSTARIPLHFFLGQTCQWVLQQLFAMSLERNHTNNLFDVVQGIDKSFSSYAQCFQNAALKIMNLE